MVRFGYYEQTHGHVPEAIEQYERALDNLPDSKSRSIALGLLGSAFTQNGDIPRAKMAFAYALQQNPDNGPALIGNGLLAEREGDFSLALAQISHAMKIEPTDVGYLLLEQALRRADLPAEADDAHAQAKRMSHDFSHAQRSAAQMLASAGIESQ
jgi:tetratricopeptide (TPR) repeat protein